MPKEYINWPQPKKTYKALGNGNKEEVLHAPAPRIGIRWNGAYENIQISFDIDWDDLQRYVDDRRNYTGPGSFEESDSAMPNRATFYTDVLTRPEIQSLIKNSRRARNDVFGSDE